MTSISKFWRDFCVEHQVSPTAFTESGGMETIQNMLATISTDKRIIVLIIAWNWWWNDYHPNFKRPYGLANALCNRSKCDCRNRN